MPDSADEVVYRFAPLVDGEHLAEYPARDLTKGDLARMTKEQRAELKEYSQRDRAIFVAKAKKKKAEDGEDDQQDENPDTSSDPEGSGDDVEPVEGAPSDAAADHGGGTSD